MFPFRNEPGPVGDVKEVPIVLSSRQHPEAEYGITLPGPGR